MTTEETAGSGAGPPSAGIDEEMIETLIRAFYAKVPADPVIGPIFDRVIGDQWDEHLPKMFDFWSSVLLGTRRFRGSPMQAHLKIPELSAAHFARWLELFRQTAREAWPPQAAALIIERAEMIAESLQLGLAVSRGLPPPGEPSQP